MPVPRCATSVAATCARLRSRFLRKRKGTKPAAASFLIEGSLAGSFDTTMYQKDPDKRSGAETVTILAGGLDREALQKGVERGQILGEAVNFARRLAITPASDMTPTQAREGGLERGARSRPRR